MVHGIGDYYSVVISGLGPENIGYNEKEILHENRENIRWASAFGIRMLQQQVINFQFYHINMNYMRVV